MPMLYQCYTNIIPILYVNYSKNLIFNMGKCRETNFDNNTCTLGSIQVIELTNEILKNTKFIQI